MRPTAPWLPGWWHGLRCKRPSSSACRALFGGPTLRRTARHPPQQGPAKGAVGDDRGRHGNRAALNRDKDHHVQMAVAPGQGQRGRQACALVVGPELGYPALCAEGWMTAGRLPRGKSGLHEGRVPGNARRGQPQGKRHRERDRPACRVRVKRWGKSPPRAWQQDWHGKPHPEQCRIGTPRGKVRMCGDLHRDTSAQGSGLAA